ncbi:MAG: TRAP transporter permease [Gammaproteobacteria bacterium]|nr:TRAP transporter permease [Gammaproteobacteria bacterium]
MAETARADGDPSAQELQNLVAQADTGGRNPHGIVKRVLLGAALAWSLFQLWIASPLPFMVGIGVFNDTQARSIHLAFAIFLAFLAYPALRRSPRAYVPIQDWVFALVGAFCAAYLFIFHVELSTRPGAPIAQDIIVGCAGIVLLLEATRRSLGPPLTILAAVFLGYTFFGPYMPEVISHQGFSLNAIINHQWITTEGVFGVALGVSTSFVFLFVLFGALLDKAGAGNYFIQVAFSLLGHLRGGPAKAAVVSSGMTGIISGSSIANVVTTGTFTIPLMKRVGYTAEQAGAVEVSSSVNGQIMPPVMGAAAFLMVEFVGISYTEVIKHAFLPALISYIALFYIVHLEALKADMQALPKRQIFGWAQRLITWGLVISGTIVFAGVSYYAVAWMRPAFGPAASWVIAALLVSIYVALLGYAARYPELKLDDPNAPVVELPEVGPTVKAGLHFLLPVVVLVWALMVEQLSPGLSAFWATTFMIFILLTQRPLIAFFRGRGKIGVAFKQGGAELLEGLITGARNMIGIGIATAAAGVIVGTVTLTGLGAVMVDAVEALSGGNIVAVLFLTAVISLILGMGLPTTANYIVVSSLMAIVIVELGAQAGLIVPLIAVHLFVFYFGIMADITPPVGLAAFAAAAISGGDPIKTGLTSFFYSLRTAALPFLFIYNTDLLLIDVTWLTAIGTFVSATIAMLLFAAATQGYFLVRSRLYESAALLLIAFILFRPGFWMDLITPPYHDIPAASVVTAAGSAEPGTEIRLQIAGEDDFGNPKVFFVPLELGAGVDGKARLGAMGIEVLEADGALTIDAVAFGSNAQKAGLKFDQKIQSARIAADQPPKQLVWVAGFLLLVGVVLMQRRRRARPAPAAIAA